MIDLIHSHGLKAGLAISPETSSSKIWKELGDSADLLLVMTVKPGQGGQKFMPECLEKVKDLRERFPGKNIQVDGGVGPGNACQCAQAGESSLFTVIDLSRHIIPVRVLTTGSNVLVAGTAVFGAKDPKQTILDLRTAVDDVIAEKSKK